MRQIARPIVGAMLLASLCAASARANDSSAELASGGLIFVQNDDVEMRAEDLFVSAGEIRVRYRFFNKAQKDVTLLVAFPMPEVRIEHQDMNISVPTEDPVNLMGFATSADGKPVITDVEQRVSAAGIDRTQLLRSLGIPLAPHLPATNEALDKLPREKWEDLIKIGLAEVEEYDIGKGMTQHLSARWGLNTTFYWTQVFPAQKELLIEHRYKPSVGGSAQTSLGAPYAAKESWLADYTRKYCLDKDFFASVERLRKVNKSEFGPPYSEQRIDYILKTGANWSGPIKDFRLVIDKGEADAMVSFCGAGVEKIAPTQFEMKKTDFSPEGNLAVLILKKLPKE